MASRVASINSLTAITDTSDVTLIRLIRLFDRLGTARRSACGPTTYRSVCNFVNPRLVAAFD